MDKTAHPSCSGPNSAFLSPPRLHICPATLADRLCNYWPCHCALDASSRVHSRPVSTFGIQSNKEGGVFRDPLLVTQTKSAGLQLEAVNGKDTGARREEVVVVDMLLGGMFSNSWERPLSP